MKDARWTHLFFALIFGHCGAKKSKLKMSSAYRYGIDYWEPPPHVRAAIEAILYEDYLALLTKYRLEET